MNYFITTKRCLDLPKGTIVILCGFDDKKDMAEVAVCGDYQISSTRFRIKVPIKILKKHNPFCKKCGHLDIKQPWQDGDFYP